MGARVNWSKLVPKDRWYIIGDSDSQLKIMSVGGIWYVLAEWVAVVDHVKEERAPVSYATKSGAANRVNKLKMREFERRSPWNHNLPKPRIASGEEVEELLIAYTLMMG